MPNALRQLNEKDIIPGFIFLELNMPRMDGKGCLGEIKKSARMKHIPVIIYSTSGNQAEIEETRKLGASYFLIKPTSFTDLNDAISKYFSPTQLKKTLCRKKC